MVYYHTSTRGTYSYIWDPSTEIEASAWDGLHDRRVSISNNPRGNNPFEVFHSQVEGSRANGLSGGTTLYKDAPSGFYGLCDSIEQYSVENPDTDGNLSNRVEARTNPSRPDILLPTFIFELRDIPGMVKELGAVAAVVRDKGLRAFKHADTATLAKANLAAQFGWRPFIQDVWKMATFAEGVKSRMRELDSLNKGGLRRNLKTVARSQKNDIVDSGTYRGKYIISSECHVSATLNWYPTYPGSALLSESQVRRQLSGVSPDNIPANIWESLPWSWFTDYFYNVGEILQAGNRTIATPGKGWLKFVTTTTVSHGPALPEGEGRYTVSAGIATSKHVRRTPLHSSSTASFPTLGAGQLSILGSLAIVKNRKVLGW
ncbi:maturation protein [ssRNA phage Gephyllon.1_28]|uniref:Maturation protein n=2 Tax=Leviviricetes TaxID=2842243 RepID=A0A8S5L208_9VIRU|nr:maturation protein [ssRNA phage Gephyllon.1_28]QDH88882.1 MAG: hypothetical protein H1BulkLitter6522_000003 [Leviviridae sp.]DAD51681.1 TPA_asm: maturation protein [ssRNA phage Gephyllon.1_28]